MDDSPKARILIVDDDANVTGALLELIQESGYDGLAAASGGEALELIRHSPVDVVVTDIVLPDVHGLELTNVIKSEHGSDVIVMTGFGEQYTYEDAIAQGASDFIIKPVRFSELSLRIKRVLKERAFDQERERMLARLQELAVTDGLTKLYNSRHFYEKLENELSRGRRYGRPLSLLLFDIDKFKRFNDTHGHIEGDRALARIARVLADSLRTTDTAFRYGGEEFTVLMPETGEEEAGRVGDRVRQAISGIVHVSKDEAPLTISVGAAQSVSGESVGGLVKRADLAMYAAKRAGGNKVALFSESGENKPSGGGSRN